MSEVVTIIRDIVPNDGSKAQKIQIEIELSEAADSGGAWITISDSYGEPFSTVFIENRASLKGGPGARIHIWTRSNVDGDDPAFIIDPMNEQYTQYQPLERIEG